MLSRLPLPQVRGELSGAARRKVNTLIITDVHGRDIVDTFVRDSVMDAREFAWESQLRFAWDKGAVRARAHAGLRTCMRRQACDIVSPSLPTCRTT